MAIYNLDNYLEKDGLGFPKNFRRGNPNPLDNSSVWASLEAAQNYATTSPVAYVGQILTIVEDKTVGESTVKTVTAYVIDNEAGDLKKITPTDDLTIEYLDGKIQLKGAADAEEGALPYMKSDGSIEWVVPSTDTVDGLQDAVEALEDGLEELQGTVEDMDAAYKAADEALGGRIDTLSGTVSDMDAAYKLADQGLGGRIDTLSGTVSDMDTAYKAADETLGGRIDDLEGVVDDMDAAYKLADQGLGERIDGIEGDMSDMDAAYKAADKTLGERIDSVESIIGEVAIEGQEATGLRGDIAQNAADIVAINNKIGTVENGKTVAELIEAVKDEASDANSAMNERVLEIENDYLTSAHMQELTQAIATAKSELIGTANDTSSADTIKAAKKYADEKIAELLDGATDETLDSIKELANAIKDNDSAIDALNDIAGTKAAKDDLDAAVERIESLEGNVSDMDTAYKAADEALGKRIDDVEGDVSDMDAAYKLADKGLGERIDGIEDTVSDMDGAYKAADEALGERIDALSGTVADMDAAYKAADEVIGGLIDALSGTVSGMDAEYKAADVALGERIDGIEDTVSDMDAAYKSADVALGERIDTLSDTVSTMDTEYKAADAGLDKKIGDLGAVVEAMDEAYKAADEGIGKRIDDLSGVVSDMDAAYKDADEALSARIDKKVEAVEGYRLISADEGTKLEKLVLGTDGSVSISAEINASNVKELGTWLTTNRDGVAGLLSTLDKGKLDGIDPGAQVNKIETITLGESETALPISGKNVNIPIATAELLGVVKGSAAENQVKVGTDGIMEVNSINVNKLVQTAGEFLILNGGGADLTK